MLFATKRYSILYGRAPEPYSLPFSFAEEPPIFKEAVEEDEAEAPAPAVDDEHSDDGFSDGEAVLIEQIVSDDVAAPAPSGISPAGEPGSLMPPPSEIEELPVRRIALTNSSGASVGRSLSE